MSNSLVPTLLQKSIPVKVWGLARTPKWLLGLFCICGLGFILRVLGIGFGLPYLSHPDEARIILDTLSMGHRMSLLPEGRKTLVEHLFKQKAGV